MSAFQWEGEQPQPGMVGSGAKVSEPAPPISEKGRIWLCACGQFNTVAENVCMACRRVRS